MDEFKAMIAAPASRGLVSSRSSAALVAIHSGWKI
jgi:hypothetical protein